MRRSRSLLAAVVVLLPACATILGIDPVPDATTIPTGSGPNSGATDASLTCDAQTTFATDEHNCGRCGHDCLGGQCQNGACQPVVVVTSASLGGDRIFAADAPVLDGAQLLWKDLSVAGGASSDFKIRGCTLPACTPSTYTDVAEDSAYGTAGGRLYFQSSTSDSVFRCALPGCDGPTPLLSGSPSAVYAKAIDRASESLLFEVLLPGFSGRQLRFCRLPRCDEQAAIDTSGSGDLVAATDGKNVYFHRSSFGLSRCSVSGCAVDGGTSVSETVRPVAFDFPRVVGTRKNDRFIVTCTLPDCADLEDVVDIFSDGSEAALSALTADESFVYWFNDDNVLRRCPLSGCTADTPPTILFAGPPLDSCAEGCARKQLIRDSVSLLWTTMDTIYRLALP